MIYALIIFYACVHGVSNAILYSRKGADAFTRLNEHKVFVSERGALVAMAVAGAFYGLGCPLVLEIVAGVLAFSFWHNGVYYIFREAISKKKPITDDEIQDAWMYQSPTTTAKLDFSYTQRLIMFLISITLMVFGHLALLLS